MANYVCKENSIEFVAKRNLKLKEDLINLLERTIKKAGYQIRWDTQLFKKEEGKVLFTILPSTETNLEVKADASWSCLFLFLK